MQLQTRRTPSASAWRSCAASGVVTQQELESAVDASATARGDAGARGHEPAAGEGSRRQDVTIRAPIAGTILERTIEPGLIIASATSNVSGGTTLFKMADLSEMQVRAKVDETDIGQIQPGMKARVSMEAYPGRTFIGDVVKIEPQAVVEQNVTLFPVLIQLENSEGLLQAGDERGGLHRDLQSERRRRHSQRGGGGHARGRLRGDRAGAGRGGGARGAAARGRGPWRGRCRTRCALAPRASGDNAGCEREATEPSPGWDARGRSMGDGAGNGDASAGGSGTPGGATTAATAGGAARSARPRGCQRRRGRSRGGCWRRERGADAARAEAGRPGCAAGSQATGDTRPGIVFVQGAKGTRSPGASCSA